MFDETLPKQKVSEFPRNLEQLSVDDLNVYVGELKAEIDRVESDIKQKQASKEAASSFFK